MSPSATAPARWRRPARCSAAAATRLRDRRAIARLVAEEEAERVVVGLPMSLSGEPGPAAKAALAEVVALSDELDVPVEAWDERFTTVIADGALAAAGAAGP